VTDGVAVAPLSVTLPQMISMDPNHVFQIVLNQKLLHKFKKNGVNFKVTLQQNHAKKEVT
jgi:hypothetical protein